MTLEPVTRFNLPADIMIARNTLWSVATGILPEPVTLQDDAHRRHSMRHRIKVYAEYAGFTLSLFRASPTDELWALIGAECRVPKHLGSMRSVCRYIIEQEEIPA